jgi:hypothetical protein
VRARTIANSVQVLPPCNPTWLAQETRSSPFYSQKIHYWYEDYLKQFLALTDNPQAYASKDLIALVDSSSLNLVATLAFWDVYPSTYETETYVQHIAVDITNKLASRIVSHRTMSRT